MKTLVYQSYRTFNVPAWIPRCMETVRSWTSAQGFDYRFIDDELFSRAPAWYRQKCANDHCLVSDLARLVVARELFAEGYVRTIWIDADLLIFNPGPFRIDVTEGFAFNQEIWTQPGPGGELKGWRGVNNAVSVFINPNTFLDFYIDACLSIVHHRPTVKKCDVGTDFLSPLAEVLPMKVLNSVGSVSPILMKNLVEGTEAPLRAYLAFFGSPCHAANLCSSLRDQRAQGIEMTDELYDAGVTKLLEKRALAGDPG